MNEFLSDIMMQPKLEVLVSPQRIVESTQPVEQKEEEQVEEKEEKEEKEVAKEEKEEEEPTPGPSQEIFGPSTSLMATAFPTTFKRPRGRPRKGEIRPPPKPKRPRGRPPKIPGYVDTTSLPNILNTFKPKFKIHRPPTNENVAIDFVNKLLGIRKPRGRPRLHPKPDPSLPKRPRGRPRRDDNLTGFYTPNVTLHGPNSTEAQLLSLVADAVRSSPVEDQEPEAGVSGYQDNHERHGNRANGVESNINEEYLKEFYPSIDYIELDSPIYRNVWKIHRLCDREIIFPKVHLEKVLDENLLISLPSPQAARRDFLVIPSAVSKCTCGFDVAESECGRYMALKLRPNRKCQWNLGLDKMEGVRFLWPFKHT